MAAITFRFRSEASEEEREQGVREISAWAGVRGAGPLRPDASDPRLQTMYYADLEDSEVDHLLARISGVRGVESVAKPAQRKLIF